MLNYREESDFIGTVHLPKQALYGIHAYRARQNFGHNAPFPIEWYKAVGLVKYAVFQTYQKMKTAALSNYTASELSIEFLSDELIALLSEKALEVSRGHYFEHFIVPAIQGGAGTSINLNINEIITNAALQQTGRKAGEYSYIDPIEHANIFQSTNDVIPTALKIATMQLLSNLEEQINEHRVELEKLEHQHRYSLRIAYTQLQEAVPGTYGNLFGAYAEALSRDWWRVSKCAERIKTVNIGGSATGTSIAVPRFMLMETVKTLREITKLPINRSENLFDATSNLDSFVEIHATLKAHAVNLEKMVSDIRLLASDLVNRHELQIPQRQVGSSIMPAKINPVIAEYTISAAQKIYANDQLVSALASRGQLELNAYLPAIGAAVLETVELLSNMNTKILNFLIKGLVIKPELAENNLWKSPAITTALVAYVGYKKAAQLAQLMKEKQLTVFEANQQLHIIPEPDIKTLLAKEKLLQQGFSIKK